MKTHARVYHCSDCREDLRLWCGAAGWGWRERRAQDLAVSQHSPKDAPEWLTILEWLYGDGHVIPELERVAAIADREDDARRLSLVSPHGHLACLVFDFEDEE